FSAPAVTERLAQLAVRARLGEEGLNEEVLAERFLDAIDALNRDLGIPTTLAALREADIPALARAALHEAHTGYPVPRYMTRAECEALIRRLLPPQPADDPPAKKAAARKAPGRKAPAGNPAAKTTAATKTAARKTPGSAR
ncbi:MAG: iron-containing alcohol dehydrogenase, partial [Rubrivivax sp.]|nr:iron-containing alcohol dehydrogenase [Rubrivivax sp.]